MNECDCESSVTEFYRFEQRTARKQRECGECKAAIPIGTRCVYLVGKDSDWGFWDFVMCFECDELWMELGNVYYTATGKAFCRCLGKLHELIQEALDLEHIRCYPFIERLVKRGIITLEQACPGAALTIEVFHDERQFELTFA